MALYAICLTSDAHSLYIFVICVDAPLAREGRVEAKKAGELLKSYGFEFDVVYTSWLSRAIETAWVRVNSFNVHRHIFCYFVNDSSFSFMPIIN